MKSKFYFLFFIPFIFITSSINAQWINSIYQTRSFGSDPTQAANLMCSNNPSGAGSAYTLYAFSAVSANPLQINKLYEFTNDDDYTQYIYI